MAKDDAKPEPTTLVAQHLVYTEAGKRPHIPGATFEHADPLEAARLLASGAARPHGVPAPPTTVVSKLTGDPPALPPPSAGAESLPVQPAPTPTAR